jgi:hypothetical protein
MREDGDGVASLGVRASRRAYRLNIVSVNRPSEQRLARAV